MLKEISRDGERMRRHIRVCAKTSGTSERPRLNAFRLSSNIHTQIIDDASGATLASTNSAELKLENGGNAEAAKTVGTEIAKRAIEKDITGVMFDRGGYAYIGRVKALAGAVRVADLKFQEAMRTERRPRRSRDAEKELEERAVTINRVTKVVKGGRRFRFAALVVIGDKKGRVGFGTGKANEVLDTTKKAIGDTKRSVFTVPAVGTTIPRVITGRCGAGEVFLRPVSEGAGVIVGSPVRAILRLVGINDILSRCLGSRIPVNMVHATISALKDLRTIEGVARLRDEEPEEIRG